jgi:alanine-alpha-ketoisovalerate/valine-pyruvate aminotransferase
VSPESVTIGIAMPPNATGAVLATSATAAAFIGLKPSAISITLQIATGVPKPASASSSAPKQNAMMSACTRWSRLTLPNERWSTAKCPVSTVML